MFGPSGHTTLGMKAAPNKALQTDKGKLSCLLHSQSHASLPLPLSLVVRRHSEWERYSNGSLRMICTHTFAMSPAACLRTARK